MPIYHNVRKNKRPVHDKLTSIQRWFAEHKLVVKLTVSLLIMLVIIPGLLWWIFSNKYPLTFALGLFAIIALFVCLLWWWWRWIFANALPLTFIATAMTGLALATFAWLTYDLSKTMVEYEYVPPIQLYSIAQPEINTVSIKGIDHETIVWRVGPPKHGS